MSEPVTFGVVVLDGDTEIATMNMLQQVMEHMTQYQSLRDVERHRIAAWFASRYGNKEQSNVQ